MKRYIRHDDVEAMMAEARSKQSQKDIKMRQHLTVGPLLESLAPIVVSATTCRRKAGLEGLNSAPGGSRLGRASGGGALEDEGADEMQQPRWSAAEQGIRRSVLSATLLLLLLLGCTPEPPTGSVSASSR